MVSIILLIISFQPFNASFSYPGDQAGKGSSSTAFGCVTAGNTILDPSGNMQILFAAYDQTGNFLWADSFHQGQSSEILAVQEWTGGVLFTGSSSNPSTSEDALVYAASPDLQQLWSFTLDLPLQERFTTAAQGTDGNIVCAGSTNSIGSGGNDVLLVSMDQYGNEIWRKTYGTVGEEAAYHISACSDGGYILACQAMNWGAGNGDYWVIRTDSKGDTLWTGTYGGPEFDYPWRVIQCGDSFFVAGNTLSYGEGSYDWWILKLDDSGTVLWSRTWGYSNTDTCMALCERGSGAVAGGMAETALNQFSATLVSFDGDGNTTDEWFYEPGMIRSVEGEASGNLLVGGYTFTPDVDLWVMCVDSTGYAPESGIESGYQPRVIVLSENPASTSLEVLLPENVTSFSVVDMAGRIVAGEEDCRECTVLNVSGLPVGIYTVSARGVLPVRFAVLR